MTAEQRVRAEIEMRVIEKRWKRVPPLRVAQDLGDALNDWPIAEFGENAEGQKVWVCTDKVHASEMVLSADEFAEPFAKARDDIRALFKIIAELGGPTS